MKPLTFREIEKKDSIEMSAKTVDIETARQMAQEAAELAAQKSMESFREFQRQNQEKDIKNDNVETETGHETDEGNNIDIFNPGTARSIKNTVGAFESLQRVFSPPPDPIRGAMEQAVNQMATDFVTSRLGGGNVGGQSASSKGPILSGAIDILNTAFGHGLGESLGAGGAETIKTLISSLGGQKQLPSGGDNSDKSGTENSDNSEKQKDQVLSLDANNPEHLKNYASAMGLSERAAKEILVYHQQDIINERKMRSSDAGSSGTSGNNEIVEALKVLINEMSGMKGTINNLQTKIIEIESGKVKEPEKVNDESVKWNDENEKVSSENRQVNLFQQPIKVDVDAIKGENLKESFFDDKQPIKEAELISEESQKGDKLEQVIDDKGGSHFKTLDSEDDKKKDDNNIINQSNNENEILNKEEKVEQKIEVQHKRIIRKPIKKEEIVKEEIIKEENVKENVTLDKDEVINN